MATEPQWGSLICQDAWNDIAYTVPCLHQFYLGGILRWAKTTPDCPLCHTLIRSIRFPVQTEKDYVEWIVSPCTEPAASVSQAPERDPIRPDTGSSQSWTPSPLLSERGILLLEEQEVAEAEVGATVGGLLPKTWASFFRKQQSLLDPVLPWLRCRLEAVYGEEWWYCQLAEKLILYWLCHHGLDEGTMVQELQPVLEEHTQWLVSDLIHFIVRQCSEKALRLLHSYAAREEEDQPAASPSPSSCQGGTLHTQLAASSSPASSNGEEEASLSEITLQRGPSHPTSALVPAEQQLSQEQPGQAVAAAGPSAQDSSCSPSAHGRSRKRSRGRPRRPPKRRSSRPQDSPQPCKRMPPRKR
ncbi:TOPRS ligase, partial [Mionectes macconnelli]|nr:TOPRS ligase [Mionectes macconnelli]